MFFYVLLCSFMFFYVLLCSFIFFYFLLFSFILPTHSHIFPTALPLPSLPLSLPVAHISPILVSSLSPLPTKIGQRIGSFLFLFWLAHGLFYCFSSCLFYSYSVLFLLLIFFCLFYYFPKGLFCCFSSS